MRILVTGGAGFIGSRLAVELAQRNPYWELVAADNLYRSGSELTLDRLRDAGVSFLQADVRDADDLVDTFNWTEEYEPALRRAL